MRFWVVAIAILTARAASAQNLDPQAEKARVHLRASIAYYDEGRYEDAAREMEAAYELKPLPDLQYNLAQCYERMGHFDQAAKAYETYLAGNPAAADKAIVTERIDNLRQRAKAVAAGQAPPPPPPQEKEKIVFKTIVVYKKEPPPPGRGVRWAAYGAGVLAVGALASGIAFAVLACEAAHTVATGGNPRMPVAFDGAPYNAQQSGRTDVIVSAVSFGVAALCAGGAIGLYLVGRKIDREAPKLTMAPFAAPSAGGLVLAGRF